MKFLKNLFGKVTINKKDNLLSDAQEHAVIVRFNYRIDKLDALHRLENKLEKVITENNVGQYDGHEIAVDYSDGILYMYGPNAENLFMIIKPILANTDFMKGARVKLRFGPPEDGTKEVDVQI